MFDTYSSAKRLRLLRLFRRGDGNLFVVPLDHSVSNGPIAAADEVDQLVGQAACSGVDAIVAHKGRVRAIDPSWFTSLSMIVHLSASTDHAPDVNAKFLVGTVEEALRMGADAVSVHVNMGSEQEERQLSDLGRVADACDRWNMPLMAMMYPRGPRITRPDDPDLVAHAAGLAVDLGADIVKTLWTGSAATMADVVASCPLPIVTAGGGRSASAQLLFDQVGEAMASGVRGVAVGRNVFEADDPMAVMRGVGALVHPAIDIAAPAARVPAEALA